MLMVIEGCDSVGKNTQSKRLVEKFDSIGRNAVVMSFPRYETTVGRAIRRHLLGDIQLCGFERWRWKRCTRDDRVPLPEAPPRLPVP